jgi:predicted secreted protein
MDHVEVTLRVGERTTIRLPGLGTSGYRWTFVVSSGDAVIVSVSPAPRPAGPPGASVDELAVIEGHHPGRATVTLEHRRSWEKQAHDQRVVEVTVTT